MEIGIIAPSLLVARIQLNKLVGEMKYKTVVYLKKDEALMKNGDHYKALPANESIRGLRFDKVIISKNVSVEFIKTVGEYLANSNENQVEFFE